MLLIEFKRGYEGVLWVMTQAVEALLPPFAERGAGGIARTGGMNETGGVWYGRLAIADHSWGHG